jgi:hypothetical protein
MAPFHDITGDRLAPTPEQREDTGPRHKVAVRKLRILDLITRIYQCGLPWVLSIAALGPLFTVVVRPLRRHSAFISANLAILAAIACMLVILAYIDITSWHAMHPEYMVPLYPLLLALCGLSLRDLVAPMLRPRPWRDAARGDHPPPPAKVQKKPEKGAEHHPPAVQ